MNLHDEIAKVAYELYEKSGKIGRDLDNWLEAEKIVMAKYARKELASVRGQMGQAAGMAAEKVKKTASAISAAAKKGVSKKPAPK